MDYESSDAGRLSPDKGKWLLAVFDRGTVRSKRDYAMIAVLLGRGLRRAELAAVTLEHLQQQEKHRIFADMVGKEGHIRTIPMPAWVAAKLQPWITAANVGSGEIFRAINKAGRIRPGVQSKSHLGPRQGGLVRNAELAGAASANSAFYGHVTDRRCEADLTGVITEELP